MDGEAATGADGALLGGTEYAYGSHEGPKIAAITTVQTQPSLFRIQPLRYHFGSCKEIWFASLGSPGSSPSAGPSAGAPVHRRVRRRLHPVRLCRRLRPRLLCPTRAPRRLQIVRMLTIEPPLRPSPLGGPRLRLSRPGPPA